MIAFIVFFFPAVLSVWMFEALRKSQLDKKQWFYHFVLNAVFINFICFAVKKYILHTASSVIFSIAADMTPAVACNYLIIAIPLAVFLAFVKVFFSKHIRVEVAHKDSDEEVSQ